MLDDYHKAYPKTPDLKINYCYASDFSIADKAFKSFLKYNKEEFIKYRAANLNQFLAHSYYDIAVKWLDLKRKGINIDDYLIKKGYKSIAIYGIGTLGQQLYKDLKNSKVDVKYYIDKETDALFDNSLVGYKLTNLSEAETVDIIIITPYYAINSIEYELNSIGHFITLPLDFMILEMEPEYIRFPNT